MSEPRLDPRTWWDSHDEGVGGRPRPGTRWALPDGREVVVQYYEGCWRDAQLPVRLPSGQVVLRTPADLRWCAT